MVRNYQRKTQRHSISEGDMKKAIREVIKKGKSIRNAARDNNIKVATLQHRVEKFRLRNQGMQNMSDSDSAAEAEVRQPKYQSKYTSRQVFSAEEETLLEEYLIKCANMQYGLTYRQARLFAYQYSCQLQQCSVPESWKVSNMAGLFWMQSFMKRHPKLSLRQPEKTSLGRATAFNKHNVDEFFNNYLLVIDKYQFTPNRILNVDETGLSTVLDVPKVISEKGKTTILVCYF